MSPRGQGRWAFAAASLLAALVPCAAGNFEELQQWLEKNGGVVSDGVGVAEHALGKETAAEGSDRGLVATRWLYEGEQLILVPKETLVSHAAISRDPLAAEAHQLLEAERVRCVECTKPDCRKGCTVVSEATPEALEQILLAIWLAREQRKAESFYRPWLDSLPKAGNELLLLPSEQVNAALGGTELLKEVLDLQQNWKLAYRVLSASSGFVENVGSYETFAASRALVMSRSHGSSDGGKNALVPLADLLNHREDPPAEWKFLENGDFVVRALRRVAPGTAIECSYGSSKPNKELLLHYGFVQVPSPKHSVSLRLELTDARSDPLYAQKKMALMEMDLYRYFKYSAVDGFGASGRPLRSLMGKGGSGEPAIVMLGEVLTFMRVAAVAAADVSGEENLLTDALLQQDEGALETLRGAHGAVLLDVERRAASLLQEASDKSVAALCGGAACHEDTILAAMKGSASLQHLASAAAKYADLDRALHLRLRHVASAAISYLDAGRWQRPVEEEPLPAYEALDDEGKELLRNWNRNFIEGQQFLKSDGKREEL